MRATIPRLALAFRGHVLWDPDDFRYVWVPIDHGHGPDQIRLDNKDGASGLGPEGRRFESFRPTNKIKDLAKSA